MNKETDKTTGWSYHGARWMASSFAMWLSPDPPVKAPDGKFMGEPWGLNPYQYVEQNPSAYWDPDGRSPIAADPSFTMVGPRRTDFKPPTPSQVATMVVGAGAFYVSAPLAVGIVAFGLLNSSAANAPRKGEATIPSVTAGQIALEVGLSVLPAAIPSLAKTLMSRALTPKVLQAVFEEAMESAPAAEGGGALVKYDGEFAARQLLGQKPVTPGGRTIMSHAAERMVHPPKGRAPMSMAEVDQVLDTADKIRKVSPHPDGATITVQSTTMPGKPQVVVDAATGTRVITVVKKEK